MTCVTRQRVTGTDVARHRYRLGRLGIINQLRTFREHMVRVIGQQTDQLFAVIGALIAMSARTAIETADAAQLDNAREIVGRIRASKDAVSRQASWRELGNYFNKINENLVLRLIGNGLKTQFMGRMESIGVQARLDEETSNRIIEKLDAAIAARDAVGVAHATQQHFNLVREKILEALQSLADMNVHKVGQRS